MLQNTAYPFSNNWSTRSKLQNLYNFRAVNQRFYFPYFLKTCVRQNEHHIKKGLSATNSRLYKRNINALLTLQKYTRIMLRVVKGSVQT